jgi:Zn-dependent protease
LTDKSRECTRMNAIDPTALIMIPVFLFAISVHEFAHAYSARLAGDLTASAHGRLTLNPLAHIDPIGTVLMPIIALVSGIPIIGWARPVPVNPFNFRKISWDIYVSLAGPFSNFLLALLAAMMGWLAIQTSLASSSQFRDFFSISGTNSVIVLLIEYFILINVILGFFNLIPIPPLDGSHLLMYFLTRGYRQSSAGLQILERFGFIILLVIIWTPLGRIFTRAIWRLVIAINVSLSLI